MSTSLYFNGNATSYLTMPYSSSMYFGTGDFTIQWFQYMTASNANQRIFQNGNYLPFTTTIGTSLEGSNSGRTFYFWKPNANSITILTPSTFLNKWMHIAISRTSGTTRFFINGGLVKSLTSDTTSYDSSGGLPLVIGNESTPSDGAAFGGYLYGFSWTKGLSLYTTDASFAVPSSLPTPDSNTVLVLTGDGFSGSLGSTVVNHNVGMASPNIPPSFSKNSSNNTIPNQKMTQSLDRKKYQFTNTSQSGRIAALKSATKAAVKQTYGGGTGVYVKNETEKNSVNDAIRRVRAGGYVVPNNVR